MERELISYRANPTDRRFAALYAVARPWLASCGTNVLSRYRTVSISGAVDDVVNEGAFALSKAARRFVHLCPECGRAFVHARDLSSHAAAEHRRRGVSGAVSLASFARTSAVLAMKRTARRMNHSEVPEADLEGDAVLDAEERLVVELTIDRLRRRLTARARASLELILRGEVAEPGAVDWIREQAVRMRLIEVNEPEKTRRTRMTDKSEKPEPKWAALNIRTLRESARDVLGIEVERRTMKTAYAEILAKLEASDRELEYSCQNCDSAIDDVMDRCWACGLVFRDEVEEAEEIADVELRRRAERIGIETKDRTREEILAEIEEVETRTRAARRNVDLLTLDAKQLNEDLTEAMPNGWYKKASKQYTAYFDPEHIRRIAVMHRGLCVHFSVEDGFLDGFPDLTFFDADHRRARHFGRTNYEYDGDTAKFALDVCKRVMKQYT